jgi:uncharacterized protein (TIGR04141 family)
MSSKFNIYKIESDSFKKLTDKINNLLQNESVIEAKIEEISLENNLFENKKYNCIFYVSKDNKNENPKWVEQYNFEQEVLSGLSSYQPFALILLKPDYSNDFWYVITHGKGHFYVNGLSVVDYGINLAIKGLIDDKKIKQLKIDNIFKSKNNKTVVSSQNECFVEPLNGNVYSFVKSKSKITDINTVFCGSSIQFNTNLTFAELPKIIDQLELYEKKEPCINIPVLLKVQNEKVADLDEKLISEFINTGVEEAGQVGVQILFNDNDEYEIFHIENKEQKMKSKELTEEVINQFFTNNNLTHSNLSNIKVKISGHSNYTTYLRNLLSFQTELKGTTYCLKDGFWWYYNSTFVDEINKYIDENINYTEPNQNYTEIYNKDLEGDYKEDKFNKELAKSHSYILLDKQNIKLKDNSKIEIADLYKDNTLFVVKIGSIGSILNYSFDQVMRSSEQLKDPINKKSIEDQCIKIQDVKNICLWLVIKRNKPEKLSDIQSLHFKMKLCEFWIKAKEFGFTPQLQIEFI